MKNRYSAIQSAPTSMLVWELAKRFFRYSGSLLLWFLPATYRFFGIFRGPCGEDYANMVGISFLFGLASTALVAVGVHTALWSAWPWMGLAIALLGFAAYLVLGIVFLNVAHAFGVRSKFLLHLR